ncbi:MAG: T9SS type A sorting domain-containing protein [Ignavibacteria bacterium]|nr:T9SS type A sorting domain-containing protein [Ignavibacteria bacterium]
MKTIRNFHFIYFTLFFFFLFSSLHAQDICGTQDEVTSGAGSYTGGYLKPHRTDLSNGSPAPSDAKLNILLVFIRFPDDSAYDPDWTAGSAPSYMNNLLATTKNASGDFWNRYSSTTALLSDYYQEVSRGTMHVTGIARYIQMNDNNNKYTNYDDMLEEIYVKLKADNTIDWPDFDHWGEGNSVGNFEYSDEGDGFIDMMGLIFRRDAVGVTAAPGAAGYVPLFGPNNYEIDPVNNKFIGDNRDYEGSGFVAVGNIGVINKNRVLGVCIHEMGHYLFANNHSTSGIMTSRGGVSVNDFFYSGFERYKLGYVDATTVNFSTNPNTLEDVSGRGSNNNLTLRVPINNNEFFLIENRRKISQYDTYMLGDTSQTDPFRPTGDYGKGVYIYHTMNGLNYTSNVDVECADGLWNWVTDGSRHPDWDPINTLPLLKRTTLPSPLLNDNPPDFTVSNYYDNADGVSTRKSGWACWFSVGKPQVSYGLSGTDKINTNYPDYWTSRELWGDRHDAWNLGYNEIFSPYSNPNTNDVSNSNTGSGGYGTGIFIHYTGLSSNTASFNIYKATDQSSLDNILLITPPSKPMILKTEEYFNGTNCHPKIVWRQNTEPDMIRSSNNGETFVTYKRYKIYKSTSANMGINPPDQQFYPENVYTYVATVDVNPSTLDASWIDNSTVLYDCSPIGGVPFGTKYPVRYRVQAVDVYNSTSVLSDFRQANGVDGSGGVEDAMGDGPNSNTSVSSDNLLPKEFNLYQNYPNPFNPVTNIQYDIPKDNFVMIKVYDLLGKEVASLINEFKPAGSYLIAFDGSKLASGIYFYKIETKDFVQTKRMILLK